MEEVTKAPPATMPMLSTPCPDIGAAAMLGDIAKLRA
jgi:hypothetical protein